nr:hypothetical protein [uncultured Prevotella sp.]
MSKTKNLAIYRPNGAAAEYSTWACNLYNGCSHSCTYCYCKRGVFGHTLGKDVPEIKALLGGDPKKAYHLFCQELDKYRDQITADGGLFFSKKPSVNRCPSSSSPRLLGGYMRIG